MSSWRRRDTGANLPERRCSYLAIFPCHRNLFLLSVFAEIFVTTNGGPGNATTTITYLVYVQSLLNYDVGGGSAGGIVAVVLANIVAFFLMRVIGKNLDA